MKYCRTQPIITSAAVYMTCICERIKPGLLIRRHTSLSVSTLFICPYLFCKALYLCDEYCHWIHSYCAPMISVPPGPAGSGQSPPAGAAAQLSVSAVPQEVQHQRQRPEAGQAVVNQQWQVGGVEACPRRGGAQTREGASQEHAGQTEGEVSVCGCWN